MAAAADKPPFKMEVSFMDVDFETGDSRGRLTLEVFEASPGGSFGRVVFGWWQGIRVAVKILPLKPNIPAITARTNFIAEAENMLVVRMLIERACTLEQAGATLSEPCSRCSEPHDLRGWRHLVYVYGVGTVPDLAQVDPRLPHGPAHFILMEPLTGGSLANTLAVRPTSEPFVARAVWELSAGLAALAAAHVVHADVRPDNIVLRTPGGDLVLTDYGLSRFSLDDIGTNTTVAAAPHRYVQSALMPMPRVRGTVIYQAPELLCRRSPNSHASDVFAMGLVFWCLASGRPHPWEEEGGYFPEHDVLTARVAGGERPIFTDSIAPSLRSIIEHCWTADPAVRPSAARIAQELRPWQVTQAASPATRDLSSGERDGRVPASVASGAAASSDRHASPIPTGPPPAETIDQPIQLVRVIYTTASVQPVLMGPDDASVAILQHELATTRLRAILAFMGRARSGKSTAANLVVRAHAAATGSRSIGGLLSARDTTISDTQGVWVRFVRLPASGCAGREYLAILDVEGTQQGTALLDAMLGAVASALAGALAYFTPPGERTGAAIVSELVSLALAARLLPDWSAPALSLVLRHAFTLPSIPTEYVRSAALLGGGTAECRAVCEAFPLERATAFQWRSRALDTAELEWLRSATPLAMDGTGVGANGIESEARAFVHFLLDAFNDHCLTREANLSPNRKIGDIVSRSAATRLGLPRVGATNPASVCVSDLVGAAVTLADNLNAAAASAVGIVVDAGSAVKYIDAMRAAKVAEEDAAESLTTALNVIAVLEESAGASSQWATVQRSAARAAIANATSRIHDMLAAASMHPSVRAAVTAAELQNWRRTVADATSRIERRIGEELQAAAAAARSRAADEAAAANIANAAAAEVRAKTAAQIAARERADAAAAAEWRRRSEESRAAVEAEHRREDRSFLP